MILTILECSRGLEVVIVLVFMYDGKDDGNLLVQYELSCVGSVCDMLLITTRHQLHFRNAVYSNALTWEVCGPEVLLRRT